MGIDWKKHIRIIKKVSVFIIGSIVLSLGTALILYEPFGDYLNQLSEEEIKNYASNPFYEISRSSFNIYLITYILFNQLPDKIKKAKYLLRGLYYILFYLFCYAVYLWI